MKYTFPPESTPLAGYTIKRAIHRGGFGEVYYAHTDGGKEVALKLLTAQRDVELRGVRQCLNLKHANLVTLFDIRTDDEGDPWVVMEYVRGQRLDDVLDEHPHGLPLDEVAAWLTGLCAGLQFLHDLGIVHRDLKPANVYREQGVVKIGDVGLSKVISESRRSAQTQSVGTVYYMAPEVSRGRYGREVDVYALGVCLYEMLTGRVPFDGETAGEILMKHLSEEPDLSPLPEPLRPVLAKALEKDPARRTSSPDDLGREFRAALFADEPEEPRVRSRSPKKPRRRPDAKNNVPHAEAGLRDADSQRATLDARSSGHQGFTAQRLSEICGALTYAAFVTVVTTVCLVAAAPGLFGEASPSSPVDVLRTVDPGRIGLFALTTLLAAWMLLVGANVRQTGGAKNQPGRLALLFIGGLVGAAASWIDRVLLIDLPDRSWTGRAVVDAMFVSFGSYPLLDNARQPTFVGYMVFFGCLFALRRWWAQADPQRPHRFRIRTVLMSAGVASVLPIVIAFPQSWALLWGVALSCVVQLSAPWIPPGKRPHRTRSRNHA